MRTSCCWSAGACRKCRRRAMSCSRFRSRSRRWCMCTPMPTSSASSIGRRRASTPRRRRSPKRCPRCARLHRPCGRPRRRPRAKTSCAGATRLRSAFPARCRWARSCSTCARCCRPTPSSATARATSRPGCTASGRSARSRASSRRPAARWATACRPASAPSACGPNARWSCSRVTAIS
ncbi:hypothetical protein D9M68_624050 [compost metagenome]